MGRSKTIPCNIHAGKHERGVCPRAGSSNAQMLIFHCCLLITVLTQDKGHQATALSTHERKLQEHSLFIFSTKIVSKRVSQPSEFNIRNKPNRSAITPHTYQVLHLPISTGPIMEVVAGFTLHLCVDKMVKIHRSVRGWPHNPAPQRHADSGEKLVFTPLTWMLPRCW